MMCINTNWLILPHRDHVLSVHHMMTQPTHSKKGTGNKEWNKEHNVRNFRELYTTIPVVRPQWGLCKVTSHPVIRTLMVSLRTHRLIHTNFEWQLKQKRFHESSLTGNDFLYDKLELALFESGQVQVSLFPHLFPNLFPYLFPHVL